MEGKAHNEKRNHSVLCWILFLVMVWSVNADAQKIAAVYCAPKTQIVTDAAGNKELADTILYIFDDGSYRQFVIHEGAMGGTVKAF